MQKQILSGIGIPAVMIVLYLLGNFGLKALDMQWVEHEMLNHMLQFQLYGLVLSSITIFITLKIAKQSKAYLRFGDLASLAQPVKLLGIRSGDNWYKTGASYLIVITLATTAFMYAGLGDKLNWSLLSGMLPWVLLFSLTNSFSEEMITRFAIVGMLDGVVAPVRIMWAAAAVFGTVHYFGAPGGPVGVLMAGFLGWLLAKSVIETKGMGIAWLVHFVQDVVIIGMMLIME
ncbi:MAG TPA: CPBP family intramembrane glutamic endopeptidase [Flavipsychrobacter sp.]|nr:CPBP family intramembrane glutamic endopeptidase [Flavipsychrobacter sp.]